MYVGHYSVALALKRVEKTASLGWLFVAAQLADILIFPLALVGIERINIVENFTQSTHFELEFIPYTHGLAGSIAWATVAYTAYRLFSRRARANKRRIALVMGAAVLSHWVLDLAVHTPDLPLLGDNSPKLGFGLWNYAPISFALEAVLLLAGAWLYLKGTMARTAAGKYGVVVMTVVQIAVFALTTFGPPPDSLAFMAVFSLVSYAAFGGMAFWLDRRRR